MSATITSFGNVLSTHGFQFAAYKTISGLQNALFESGQRSISNAYTFGTSAGLFANQIVSGTLSLAGGATTDYNLSTGMTLANVVGTSSPTITALKEIWIELLSAAQTNDAGTAGSATTSITLGADGGQPWTGGPLGATDTYTIKTGEKWIHTSNVGAGMAVTASDILQILNNDGAVAAKIQVTLLGIA